MEAIKEVILKEREILNPSEPLKYLQTYRQMFCEDEYTLSDDKITAWYGSRATGKSTNADAFLPASFYDAVEDYTTGKVNKFGKKLDLDRVNLNSWWDACFEVFPILTVTHARDLESREDVKRRMIEVYEEEGFLKKITEVLAANPNARILEIGPGYGQAYDWIKEHHPSASYYALDVSKQFDCPTLYIGNGKTFPKQLARKKFDFVFSSNCFQHLSYRQKISYFKAISRTLKQGGEFWFSTFVIPTHPQYLDYAETVNPSCLFFGQRVPIQKDIDILHGLHSYGLGLSTAVLKPYPKEFRIFGVNFMCIKD